MNICFEGFTVYLQLMSLVLVQREKTGVWFYFCDILKCNVICIPLILSSKNIETWQVKKDFNIPNDIGGVQTYLIKFIC